ncbi:MAG: transcription termination factor NusA [Candidatus Nealsonbacteria bacterium RBG_13_38_11]|uniref:Transcription termination/antitermination protein NusA n=1 Tax=Candidatus Nealsonbacteria bacterium RBG_13_38_11 TaxID=1801662 RepID=A0A1G2E015_9BACT|nr:MAG: transcription termination factor NusA [Candidatus Nealsonbacteria bacterium RBG_13_38_11]HXK32137.1 transcription termination factor NusA [Candidatus Paceibacterota bacterium]
MFDIKNFMSAIAQIAEEKSISPEKVLETIEVAIAAAYKKDYGKKGQIIKAKLDPESGEVQFKQIKIVVDKKMIYSEEELEKMKTLPSESFSRDSEKQVLAEDKKIRFNPEKHIMLEEAKKINSKIKVGEELETDLEEKKDYGRIAAQTAKQVILQKIREAEKESVFTEYKSKEGEIVSGIVQRIEGRNVFMDVGKTLGILPREEQVPGEFYRPGQRLKVFLLKVEEMPRGPVILLSRAYPKLISKLFELEAPEVSSGQVQIKSIAREAGFRSKIAVSSETEGIDPIGSMVGQKGTRVMAVINELGGEKIDIIEYSPDSEKYIANSLSPAKVLEVKIMPKSKAIVIVPEDQLSLAIGKDGQNVRLAAKLTGWKIDVKAEGYVGEEKKEEEPKEEKETKKPKKKETKKVKK